MISDLYFYVFYIGRPQLSSPNPTEDQRDFETISQIFLVLCHHKIADTSVLDCGTYELTTDMATLVNTNDWLK